MKVLWAWRWDALALGGAGVAVYGIGTIYEPAGVIGAGVAVITWAIMASKGQTNP